MNAFRYNFHYSHNSPDRDPRKSTGNFPLPETGRAATGSPGGKISADSRDYEQVIAKRQR